MSRIIKFNSCEPSDNGYWFRHYNSLFIALGYKAVNNEGFRINGAGMDMVFHTNYTNIREFYSLGFISKEECASLEQKTPTVL